MVLSDTIAIYSHSCIKCDQNLERLQLKLYGQNMTSGPNTCDTGTLDHKNDFDFNGGRKVFDGRKDDGQKDENEISMLGSCYEVKKYSRIIF